MNARPLDTPVLIVGAGPAGLSLALCLARLGVESRLVDRLPSRGDHPRAHYVNTRSMELFKLWGIEPELLAEAFPLELMHFGMIEAIGGTSLAERKAISPSQVVSVAQDIVERGLARTLAETGLARTEWDSAFVRLEDLGDHVVTTVAGEGGERQIRSRWVVGCDGSGSPVRRALGVQMLGDPDLGSVINMYFHGAITPGGKSSSIGMISKSPRYKGPFICMDGFTRWCFHCHYDPAVESPADYGRDRCVEVIREAAGVGPDVEIDLHSIRPWTMTALVAERMRQGNVFLAGDAAHAFPPTGGFGMNSGVGDAHNLAWKLKAVLDGIAGEPLLASYDAERRPVACLNTAQSFRNAGTLSFTGLHGASHVDEGTLAAIEAGATRSVRSVAAQHEGEARQKIEMLEHVAALGQEIGYAYDRSPVIVDDGSVRPPTTVAHYIPNACPGGRAPNFTVRLFDGDEASSIHLLDGSMTLLTTPDGGAWRDALTALNFPHVRSIVVGEDWPTDVDAYLRLYGVGPDGVVLVRPDGHVAFRSHGDGDAASLGAAILTALGQPNAGP